MTKRMRLVSTVLAVAASCCSDLVNAQDRQLRGLQFDEVDPGTITSDGNDPVNGGAPNPCESVIAIDYLRIPKEENIFDRALSDDSDDGDDPGEEFLCELKDGYTIPLTGTPDQLTQLRAMLADGTLVSAENSVEVDAGSAAMVAALTTGSDGTPLGGEELVEALPSSVSLPPGSVTVTEGRRRLNQERRLATYLGTKKFLIVRVIDADNKQVPENVDEVSDKWFGSSGDTVTFKSQTEACSFNQLQIDYGTGGSYDAPGTIEVTVNIKLSDSDQGTIRNKVQSAAESKIGNLKSQFHHVAYILEGCYKECGWAAYAFINSWNSVYQNKYFKMVGVQMHEIGHNLNFAHSGGLDGKTYTDHTGLMGNPLYEDDIGGMCFNPAKNYQMSYNGKGWYDTDYIKELKLGNDGVWRGTFVGVGEYDLIGDDQYVVAKIETGTSEDFFVGFNRAAGPNSDNDEADDEVTIVEAGNNGQSYKQSYLRAHLQEGETYTASNKWVVRVNKIDTSTTPGTADVSICTWNCPALQEDPTNAPTKVPTPVPTASPTKNPTASPTKSPTNTPTAVPTAKPLGPTRTPTPPPTATPTKTPTPVPTATPTTAAPSRSPTHAPTSTPTKPPTSSPTRSPTMFPTRSPVVPGSCGDGFCDEDEEPDSCPQDCEIKALSLSTSKKKKAKFFCFNLEASTDVVVTDLKFVPAKNVDGKLNIYTRQGGFEGYETQPGQWDTVLATTVEGEKKIRTDQIDLGTEVRIAAGDTQAFCIDSKVGIMYDRTAQSSNFAAKNDGNLSISNGVAMRKPFQKSMGSGELDTTISYYGSAKSLN